MMDVAKIDSTTKSDNDSSLPMEITQKPNRNQYMKEYRKKNKDKTYRRIKCDICGNYYDNLNKTNHMRTRKHQMNDLQHKLDKLMGKL